MKKLLVLGILILSFTKILSTNYIEIGTSYGSTWDDLSPSDLTQEISDTSLFMGIGSYFDPIENLGVFEYNFTLNVSIYRNEGNGYAVTPIGNISFLTKRILNIFHLYLGTGIGIGFDYMKIPKYTNKHKWTIDISTGFQYPIFPLSFIRVGAALRHKSHSFIGPYRESGTNIGYNEMMLVLSVKSEI